MWVGPCTSLLACDEYVLWGEGWDTEGGRSSRRGVGGNEGGVMEVVVDVEYGSRVVKWVWEVIIVSCVSYGVSPNGAAYAHRNCYVCVI